MSVGDCDLAAAARLWRGSRVALCVIIATLSSTSTIRAASPQRITAFVGTPEAVAVSGSRIILSADAPPGRAHGHVYFFTPTGHVVRALAVGTHPYTFAVGRGKIWIANAAGDFAGTRDYDDSVEEVSSKSGRILARRSVPNPTDVAVGRDALWVASTHANDRATLLRLDPTSLRRTASVSFHGTVAARALAVTPCAVWVVAQDVRRSGTRSILIEVDPMSMRIRRRSIIAGIALHAVASGCRALIPVNVLQGPAYGRVVVAFSSARALVVPLKFAAVDEAAVSGNRVWVATGIRSAAEFELTRFRVLRRIRRVGISSGAVAITAAGDKAWMIDRAGSAVVSLP